MKFGLFSDVHANWEAFSAVIEEFNKERVDQYVFLGDIVGYGADPVRCVRELKELIKRYDCQCLAGNHDHAACGLTDTALFNAHAKASIEWTKRQLEKEDFDFLAGMKMVFENKYFLAVHANPAAPKEWGYILDIDDAYVNFKCFQQQLCFIGHSHRPIIFTQFDTVDAIIEPEVKLKKKGKYIINIGSVGQPRDGNPAACCAIYDTDKSLVEIRRVRYDITTAQEKIYQANLPKILAERLSLGK